MTSPLLDSLSLKIRSFMHSAGFSANLGDHPTPSDVKEFEQENDLTLMRFLEYEWIQEQIKRDFETGVFRTLK